MASPTERELTVRTVGPCLKCGHELLVRTLATIGVGSVRVAHLLDCGGCPTLRVEEIAGPTIDPPPF